MGRKKTFEEVKAAFAEMGWELPLQEYGGADASLLAVCPNGHEKRTRYRTVMNRSLVCKECKRLQKIDRKCHECGKVVGLSISALHDGKPVCRSCYKAPVRICFVCGESRPTNKFDECGNSICRICYKQPKFLCSVCMDPQNLQWLPKSENLSKNASFDPRVLEVYLEHCKEKRTEK